jgi:hypothetical protein
LTGSISTTPDVPVLRGDPDGPTPGALERAFERVDPAVIGAAFVLLALLVYVLSNPARQNTYNHFVWQAQAFLHLDAAIPWKVPGAPSFQDVMPLANRPGFGLIPFPPLPAVLLMPLVAIWGVSTNAALFAAVLGAVNVGLCWRMLLRIIERRSAAALGTVFYGFGTVAWYAAMLGSTWFLAHIVASTFLFLAITAALDAERREAVAGVARGVLGFVDLRQALAGFLLGVAALSRLTTILGAPLFVVVGGGGSWMRRAISAGLGAAIPVGLLVAYNLSVTGHVFNPAYDYIARTEYHPPGGQYNPAWDIEDLRYVPGNAVIMLLWPPEQPATTPDCAGVTTSGLGVLLDKDCPAFRPDPLGMSLLLTSPAYLLGIPALFTSLRRRLVAGAAIATVAIAFVNLMHFSQGWVQFGYRFSNDFAPFGMVLVGVALARFGVRRWSVALVAASVLVNAWGVYWGVILGW